MSKKLNEVEQERKVEEIKKAKEENKMTKEEFRRQKQRWWAEAVKLGIHDIDAAKIAEPLDEE